MYPNVTEIPEHK